MNYLDLPVYKHKDLILKALETNQVVVVESPTGSGKTTQLPVILMDAGYGNNGVIGVTQPRRIAAVSVSEFIARQLGTPVPGVVGYKMRFEDKTTRDTKIKIMTDGILLQEMKLDPWLSKYGCLIVDEAHERSLNIDFILGLLKRVLESRKEFKVIVSSATINASVFSEYFGECPVVKIDSVTYPVTMIYDPPAVAASAGSQLASEALLEKISSITERIISEKREGDILIFLSGEKTIKDCMGRLAMGSAGPYLHIVPLYGRLGKEEQERVFEAPPKGKTKVVISTNIAETSVTIDGITAVLDSGLSKLNYYNPRTFTSSLIEAPISKASANQRRGRAGRTREGTCYRLYNRKDFENRILFTTEEIYRTDLSEVVLRMADLGVTAFEEFDFISPPNHEGLIAAIETLNLLDALESDRTLSRTGKLMTEFPLPPRQSRIIVEAILKYPEVTEETVIAAAFLSTQSPYILPPGEETDARKAHHGFRDPDGDFVSYLKLYRSYMDSTNKQKFCEKSYLDEKAMAEIANVVAQLAQIVSDMEIPVLSGGPVEDYLCCIARGLIQFVCVREGRELYRSLTADRILIHPGSVMFRMDPEYIVAGEIVRTTRMYAMSVSPLSYKTLEKISPELFKTFGGSRGRRTTQSEKLKRPRDFTNNVKIGDEIFEIETIRGKKEVKLPWEKLSKAKDKITPETASLYKNLKGTIIVGGKYSLLPGEKLSLILTLTPSLNPEEAWNKKLPNKGNLDSKENLDELLDALPLLVTPALCKAKGKNTPKGTIKKELGFIALFTDGDGNYWMKVSRGFHTSLNESLSSVETLIDELGDEVDIGKKHIVNQTYRRLSDLLG
ncbi:helicase-related protein [Leadbettera azotonutricia]|uniref:ATP-dependent RNA helicase HrpA n=1 Tax=Leadbettera azotonutricia (strain ATCC BAA-888 / DSM 13862 / ZAS-9) TaxID=545695 RepID=F5YCU6_LEAAZ|nr:ATP-dependent RNA helicase [Leadbettera azotonutricia]AEF80742.1 ATP-dependent RNA helicase HrpA [Leadbettera azotonutricia ZAS-9]